MWAPGCARRMKGRTHRRTQDAASEGRSQENEIVSHDEVFQIGKQKAEIVKLIVARVAEKI